MKRCDWTNTFYWYTKMLLSAHIIKLKYKVQVYIVSVDILSQGGTDIVFGDFTPTWRLQRKVAHAALRYFEINET